MDILLPVLWFAKIHNNSSPSDHSLIKKTNTVLKLYNTKIQNKIKKSFPVKEALAHFSCMKYIFLTKSKKYMLIIIRPRLLQRATNEIDPISRLRAECDRFSKKIKI